MLDFHSHLIPGVDDGSKDIKMSVGMLDLWKEQGVDFICATPHFYADSNSPSRFLEKRNTAYASLMEALQQTPEGLSSYPAPADRDAIRREMDRLYDQRDHGDQVHGNHPGSRTYRKIYEDPAFR